MSKRSEIKIALEKFLRAGDGKAAAAIVRDSRRRPILIPEEVVDIEKIHKSGRSFLELGRRIRVLRDLERKPEEVWIIPIELRQISRDEPSSAADLDLPFGRIVHDHGLWLKYAPGFREIGINDRGDIVIGFDPDRQDPAHGPVKNSVNTLCAGRAKRLVTRLETPEHDADRAEAEAWLRALAVVGAGKTLKAEFKSAGVDCTHLGNDPYLHRTMKLNFFDVRDSEMLRIESLIRLRFRKVRRDVPRITVYSLVGVPRDQNAYAAFQKKLKAQKKDPAKLGLPAKLSDSRFYDPASKGVLPSSFSLLARLSKVASALSVITVNTDSHADVRSRGILSPLTAIMSLIDVISGHAGVAVLNKAGTGTSFMGAAGAGKTAAVIFWSGKKEKYRRLELRRRYEMDLRRTPDAGRLGEVGIQKELDRIMERVGILCQEDWVEILKEGAGHWVFWPAERMVYARTDGFPGLCHVLSEHDPLLENVAADFGGGRQSADLGRVSHDFPRERIFYDPNLGHLTYDRSPRMISANVLLERDTEQNFLVRKVAAREAVDWLIRGRSANGTFEPLYNGYPEFNGVLMQLGITGDKLVEAYEKGHQGDYTLLGGGDARAGQAVYERLDVLVKLWMDNYREVPTFLMNGAAGLEITQDANWLLSEHPELFGGWKQVSLADFQKYMNERYGVTYGSLGEWTHVSAHARLA